MADAKAKFRIEGEDATAAAFRSALGNAQSAATAMQRVFETAFAGISIAAIVNIGRAALEYGDSIAKASQKSGIGVTAMSELAYAAKMTNVDLGALSTGLKKMEVAISEAGTGVKAPAEAFKAIGINFGELRKQAPEKQLESIATAIARMEDPTARARAELVIFGRSGNELAPLFEGGAAGIEKLRQAARDLGQSMSPDQVDKLEKASDKVKNLKAAFDGLAASITASVAPALGGFFDSLRVAIGGGSQLETLTARLAQLKREMSQASTLGRPGGLDPYSEEGQSRLKEIFDIETQLYALRAKPLPPPEPNPAVDKNAPGFVDEEALKRAAALRKRYNDEYQRELAQYARDQDALERKTQTGLEREITAWHDFRDATILAWAQDLISEEEALKRLHEYQDIALEDVKTKGTQIRKHFRDFHTEIENLANEAGQGMMRSLSDFFFDPFKDGLSGMVQGFATAIRRMIADAAALAVMRQWFGFGAPGQPNTGFALGLETLVGSIFKGFQGGGSFAVGGAGGTDSSLVAFRATPGELVSVTPPGGGGRALALNYAPTINIDSRADRAQVAQDMQRITAEGNRQMLALLLRYNPGLRV